MLQNFTASTRPEQGPPRLAALRAELAARGISGFLVPRADAWQGEYVSPRDARLAWLTGFTGSAGFALVLPEIAGVFVDGRYRIQVREQCDLGAFTPVDWPETDPADWLKAQGAEGVIGFDPWLHTPAEIERLERGLKGSKIRLEALENNPLDAVWPDQPAPARGAVRAHPLTLAGESPEAKRALLAEGLRAEGKAAVAITLPDSISWLLNIRGSDIERNPVVQAFAVLHADARLDLFIDGSKLPGVSLDDGVRLHPLEGFLPALLGLNGATGFDPATAPVAVANALANGLPGADPCLLPKARKNPAELAGMRAAHLRDGAAMVEFLAWFETEEAQGTARPLTEIDMAVKLETFRTAAGELKDLSFDTISATGPNAALPHYRVTEGSNRTLMAGELYLVDSGGQFTDGTTDITRTFPVGKDSLSLEQRDAYTRVLKGMIAVSRARFPKGVAGGHLDALARAALWAKGLDYDHGTGHGVGAALSVHEGPVRISRISLLPLEPGMILSNEPGYYRSGGFGIRIENLLVVEPAPEGIDPQRRMLGFETLTLCPIHKGPILPELFSSEERAWLDAYHARVLAALEPLVSPAARVWLREACAPL